MHHLLTKTVGSNIHESAIYVNELHLARFVVNMQAGGSYTTIVFRVENYDEYVFVATKLGQPVKSREEYSK